MTRFVAVVGMIRYQLFDSRFFLILNLVGLQPIRHWHVAKRVLLILVNPEDVNP